MPELPSAPPKETSAPPTQPIEPSSAMNPVVLVVVSLLVGLIAGGAVFLMWLSVFRPQPVVTPPSTNATSTTPGGTSTSTLTVDWKNASIANPDTDFGGIVSSSFRVTNTYPDGEGNAYTETEYGTYEFFRVGTVNQGSYKGHTVYLARNKEFFADAPVYVAPGTFYLLVHPQKTEIRLVGAGEQSSRVLAYWPKITAAPEIQFRTHALPDTLTLRNGKTLTKRDDPILNAVPEPRCITGACDDRLPVTTTIEGVALYQGKLSQYGRSTIESSGCLIAYREDGTGVIYESLIPATSASQRGYETGLLETGSNDLQWLPAFANSSTYEAREQGGCGGFACATIASEELVSPKNLVRAGQTAGGDAIYVLKPELLNEVSANYYVRQAYDGWFDYDQGTREKSSFDEFLRRIKVPVFFWQDALGRYVVYKNAVSAPLLECGKPVIYLYPTKEQDIHVQLPSFINVTVSDPTYPSNGWTVTAKPTGKLYEHASKKNVTSLFWEGTGVSYSVPTTGFIVKQADVESFLKTTLAKYGMNEQEAKEFMEFWVPLMTGSPYYRISFLTDDWSKAAPLSVSPRPRTSIRLFMDWEKLAAPISLSEPTITTPTRNGFTLVEWGGLLRK